MLSMLQRLGRIGYGSLSQLQVHNRIWTHTLAVFPGLHPASWYIPYSRKLSRKKKKTIVNWWNIRFRRRKLVWIVQALAGGCGHRLIITSCARADRELKQRWAENWYQQDLTSSYSSRDNCLKLTRVHGGFRCCHWTSSALPAGTRQHTWFVCCCCRQERCYCWTRATKKTFVDKSFANIHKTSPLKMSCYTFAVIFLLILHLHLVIKCPH